MAVVGDAQAAVGANPALALDLLGSLNVLELSSPAGNSAIASNNAERQPKNYYMDCRWLTAAAFDYNLAKQRISFQVPARYDPTAFFFDRRRAGRSGLWGTGWIKAFGLIEEIRHGLAFQFGIPLLPAGELKIRCGAYNNNYSGTGNSRWEGGGLSDRHARSAAELLPGLGLSPPVRSRCRKK